MDLKPMNNIFSTIEKFTDQFYLFYLLVIVWYKIINYHLTPDENEEPARLDDPRVIILYMIFYCSFDHKSKKRPWFEKIEAFDYIEFWFTIFTILCIILGPRIEWIWEQNADQSLIRLEGQEDDEQNIVGVKFHWYKLQFGELFKTRNEIVSSQHQETQTDRKYGVFQMYSSQVEEKQASHEAQTIKTPEPDFIPPPPPPSPTYFIRNKFKYCKTKLEAKIKAFQKGRYEPEVNEPHHLRHFCHYHTKPKVIKKKGFGVKHHFMFGPEWVKRNKRPNPQNIPWTTNYNFQVFQKTLDVDC